MATKPGNTQPLDWSHLSAGKVIYDSLKSLCNTTMLEHMDQRCETFDLHKSLDSYMVHRVIVAWNEKATNNTEVMFIRDGGSYPLVRYTSGELLNPVYVSMNNGRCEGCGYFQVAAAPVSNLSLSNTMSAISQIDIKPSFNMVHRIHIATPTGYLTPKSASRAVGVTDIFIASAVNSLRESSAYFIDSIKMLHCLKELFDDRESPFLKPSVRQLLAELFSSENTAQELETTIRRDTTEEDSEALIARWHLYYKRELQKEVKQRQDTESKREQERLAKLREFEDAKQRQVAAAKQHENGDARQKDEETVEEDQRKDKEYGQNKDVKEGDHEGVKQKEREVTEQKAREEAIAIATSYAEQDRYDSCSDSDEG